MRRIILSAALAATLFGAATAAPTIELRGGDRDGSTVGLGVDTVLNYKATAGGILEFGEDDSVLLLGRLAYLVPAGKVKFYMGADLGLALEEVANAAPTVASFAMASKPGCARHGCPLPLPEDKEEPEPPVPPLPPLGGAPDTDEHNTGLAAGVVLGVRGVFKVGTGVGWFVEALARDTDETSGVGFAAGLRFGN